MAGFCCIPFFYSGRVITPEFIPTEYLGGIFDSPQRIFGSLQMIFDSSYGAFKY